MSFEFVYDEMLQGYHEQRDNTNYFDNDDKIICFMINSTKKYESASRKQKRNMEKPKLLKNQGYLGAFVKQNIDRDNIRKINFIDEKHVFPSGRLLYPLGLYSILNQKLKSLFIVFPTPTTDHMTKQLITGNHFSFMYNRNDNNQVHLHQTRYIPKETDITIGEISRYQYHFPDNIQLPLTTYKCDVFNDANIYKTDILDLCRFHKIADFSGGSGKRTVSTSQNLKKEISKKMEQALLLREIKGVTAIGYKHENKWHMTVGFEWVEQEEEESSTDSDVESTMSEDYSDAYKKDIAFILDNPSYISFQSELTRRLESMPLPD